MKIIPASYEILTDISLGGKKELELIEMAARTSHKSKRKTLEETLSFVKKWGIHPGHESILEYSTLSVKFISVKFIVDRGVSHELVASFTKESTRYCNYSKEDELTFIDIWPVLRDKYENPMLLEIYDFWKVSMMKAETTYLEMMKNSCVPELARSVLPNSLKTEIVVTANYREWREVFKQGCAKTAHPQMREVMIPLHSDLKSQIPAVFDDILEV